MKLTRATHLLAVLLIAISHQASMAQKESLSRLLWENADFKVFAVRDPGVLPSISQPAFFGVFLVRDRDAGFLRTNAGVSFLGSSGQRSQLVYGTPEGVLPYIDKTLFLKAGTDLIWVVPKSQAEITEPVFRNNLPDSFIRLVRDDLRSIGALADRASQGQLPTDKELARARAAIDDLSFKSRCFSFYNDSTSAPQQIYVTVRTRKEGQERQDWAVWYVPDGWEGDKDHTREFDKRSSPTHNWMNPGWYKMWARRNGKDGAIKHVAVGDTRDVKKEIDLEVP